MQISGSLYPDIIFCSSSWYRSETHKVYLQPGCHRAAFPLSQSIFLNSVPLQISKHKSSYFDTQQRKPTYMSLIQHCDYFFLPWWDVGVQPNKTGLNQSTRPEQYAALEVTFSLQSILWISTEAFRLCLFPFFCRQLCQFPNMFVSMSSAVWRYRFLYSFNTGFIKLIFITTSSEGLSTSYPLQIKAKNLLWNPLPNTINNYISCLQCQQTVGIGLESSLTFPLFPFTSTLGCFFCKQDIALC